MFSLSAFEKSLAHGTGRAALMIQEFWHTHAAEMRPALLHAIQNDLRYDQQTDIRRALYLYDLIGLTGERSFFLNVTLQALETVTDDNYYQLMELTRRFAQDSESEARRALYAAFEKDVVSSDELDSGVEIVELDGADGLLWLAEHYRGEIFGEKGYDTDDFAYLISILEEHDGKEKAWRDLEAKCALNSAYETWFQEWKSYADNGETRRKEFRQNSASRSEITYDILREMIATVGRKVGYIAIKWGSKATPEELERAAHDLLAETDIERIISMMRIFTHAMFPLDPTPLIAWAKSEDEALHWFTQRAIANISHPEVRRFALELLKQGKERDMAQVIAMLSTNYVEGDETLVLNALTHPLPIPDYRHSLCVDAKKFDEAHPSEHSVELLTLLYSEMNCAMCREGVVERLDELDAIPDWMRAELPYDADKDSRIFAIEKNARPQSESAED